MRCWPTRPRPSTPRGGRCWFRLQGFRQPIGSLLGPRMHSGPPRRGLVPRGAAVDRISRRPECHPQNPDLLAPSLARGHREQKSGRLPPGGPSGRPPALLDRFSESSARGPAAVTPDRPQGCELVIVDLRHAAIMPPPSVSRCLDGSTYRPHSGSLTRAYQQGSANAVSREALRAVSVRSHVLLGVVAAVVAMPRIATFFKLDPQALGAYIAPVTGITGTIVGYWFGAVAQGTTGQGTIQQVATGHGAVGQSGRPRSPRA
jgi:hypothetical protein